MGRAIPPERIEEILAEWAERGPSFVVIYWSGIDTLRSSSYDDKQDALDFAGGPVRGRVFQASVKFREVTPRA